MGVLARAKPTREHRRRRFDRLYEPASGLMTENRTDWDIESLRVTIEGMRKIAACAFGPRRLSEERSTGMFPLVVGALT